MSEDDGKVVEFRRREPTDTERLELVSRAPVPSCRHMRRQIVDEQQRTVQCGDCGTWLDPIWALLAMVDALADVRARLERERQSIDAEKRRAVERQQAAIARSQRKAAARRAEVVKANCQACNGTGWRPSRKVGPHGQITGAVDRCECRKSGARLV